MISRDAKDSARELKIVHTAGSHLRNVVHNNTSCLLDKRQTYNEKMASRTSKYAKVIEALGIAYKFDDEDPITILLSFRAAQKSLEFKWSFQWHVLGS